MAAGRFPELPSVTPAGQTQPGTSTATAILPRPRPCWPRPLLPLLPRPARPRPVRTLRPDVTVPPPPSPSGAAASEGCLWDAVVLRLAHVRLAPRALARCAPDGGVGDALLVTRTSSRSSCGGGGWGGTAGATPQAKRDPDSALDCLPSARLFLTVHLPGWQPSSREPSPAGRGDGSLLLSVSPDRSLMNSTLL